MTEHPCAKGLTPACFAAHPAWARKAFAYKLLHVMLPKQLTKKLPVSLRLALVPPGVEIPPGVVLPPGAVVPPGTVFPPGWTPGDPAPPGVQLPPAISPVPPGSGALPPLYVQPFEPGPAHGPAPGPGISPPVFTSNPESNYSVSWIPLYADYNFDMVDDYPDVDDSTYNYAYTDFSVDEFLMTPLNIPVGAIISSVELYIRGHAVENEWGSISAFIVIDDVQHYAVAGEWFSNVWVENVFSWPLNPQSGLPWNWYNFITTPRCGYRSEATMVSGVWVSRLYLKVNYTV